MLICLVFVFVAGMCEGLMDTLQFHYERTSFKNDSFWNPLISWKNKYKDNDPVKGEKFLFSTTALVAFTDGWHFMKLLRNLLLFLFLPLIGFFSTSLLVFTISLVLSRVIYGLGFYLSYDVLYKK